MEWCVPVSAGLTLSRGGVRDFYLEVGFCTPRETGPSGRSATQAVIQASNSPKNEVGGDYPCEVETRLPFDEWTAPLHIGKGLAISRHDVWASALPWTFEWAGYALPEQGGL
jgi:hypothetical protein